MTGQEIIELIRKKQHSKAFYRLYKYQPVVKKLVMSKGGSRQDAEDVFQEALIILCRKAEDTQFVLTSSVDTYLYSVSRFLWKNELKKRNKITETDLETGFDEKDESEIAQLTENESRFKLAEESLKKIGEKCFELLQLFYVKMKSMKEIASRLDFSSEKIAKNQKYKCLEKAKENYRNAASP